MIEDVKDEAITHFREDEGDIPHFYCDINGYVTIAVGCFVAQGFKPSDLGVFVNAKTGEPATDAEVLADWQRVYNAGTQVREKKSPAKTAQTYAPFCDTRLTDESREALLWNRILRAENETHGLFPLYHTWPIGPQLGAVDFTFNIGIGNVRNENPGYCAVLHSPSPDWETAGRNCALLKQGTTGHWDATLDRWTNEDEHWRKRNRWKLMKFREALA